jgi:hypothetical protein
MARGGTETAYHRSSRYVEDYIGKVSEHVLVTVVVLNLGYSNGRAKRDLGMRCWGWVAFIRMY